MNTRTPLYVWLTEVLTVFVNGAIAGLPGGSAAGAGGGTLESSPAAKLHTALVITALSILGNGVKRVVVWHDTNPMPNPFLTAEPAPKLTTPPAVT